MNKRERDELKAEIKKELLSELKGGGFDYEEYKKEVVQDDIKKLEHFWNNEIRWTYFIPIIGAFIYWYHLGKTTSDLDRGTLRSNLVKTSVKPGILLWNIFFLYTFPLFMFFNFQFFIDKIQHRIAIEMTKEENKK